MSENQLLRKLTDEELRSLFLEAASGETKDANQFFSHFAYVQDLLSGNYSAALNHGISLLNKCLGIDKKAYDSIHKGTVFYWLGTAAFHVHDYQTAVFFYDAAVSEDLRAGSHPVQSPTPALRFIQIEGKPRDQAARPLVKATQDRVKEVISDYNRMPGRPSGLADLDLAHVRKCFLRLAVSPDGDERWRSLATAFISFFLEWDYLNTLLDLRPGGGTAEPFFIHLFKGCVLFESLLKANPKDAPPAQASTLGLVLQHLHARLVSAITSRSVLLTFQLFSRTSNMQTIRFRPPSNSRGKSEIPWGTTWVGKSSLTRFATIDYSEWLPSLVFTR